jgi:hypothetical protein
VLHAIKSAGSITNQPSMKMKWFCATPGVERFELALAVDDGGIPATFSTNSYPLESGNSNLLQVVVAGVTNDLYFGFYRTGRIGTKFGTAGSPSFTLLAPVQLDRTYTLMLRAIGPAGIAGPWSNVQTFRWNTVPDDGPQVPWPARPLPAVQQSTFHTNLTAAYLADSEYQDLFGEDYVGVRIGEIPSSDVSDASKPFERPLTVAYDPEVFLYTNAADTAHTAFPCVLYRYQVANELYQTVSGDVAQVSPLMENIAWGKDGSGNTVIYDPFVLITRPREYSDPWGIYLLDTQPVVRGATYQYLLLRFNEQTREIDRIIPAGTVTIP